MGIPGFIPCLTAEDKMLSLLTLLIKDIWKKSGSLVLTLWLLMILVGLFDGIGMAMLLPLLNLIGVTTNQSGTVQVFAEHILSVLGFSLDINSVIIVLTLIFSIQACIVILQGLLVARVETAYVDQWRSQLMKLFFNAEWPFFVKNKLGNLVYIIILQTENAGRAFFGFSGFVAAVIMVLIYLTASLLISWKFTLFLGAISIMLTCVLLAPIIKLSYRSGINYDNLLAGMQAATTDYVSGIKLIKATGTEHTVLNNLRRMLRFVSKEYFNSIFFPYALRAIIEFSSIIFLCGFLFIGVKYLAIQTGAVFVLLAIFFRTARKIEQVNSSFQTLVKYLPSFKQITKYAQNARDFSENNLEEVAAPVDFSESPDINITNLSVNYGDNTVLSNVTLSIPSRKTLGIIGGSGAGKSTLVDCVIGLTRPASGQILINGQDLNKIPIFKWRNSIGYVTQETILFHDTVKANIIWGNDEISNSELINAAKKAHAHEFIQSLPNGYDTIVGDKGTCLSGGQRQRVALARAMLRCPVLLVFDEATNALDSVSEKEVLDAVFELKNHATIIMISHRLSAIKNADNILVLDQGRAVDEGAWDDLISRNKNFIEMLKIQSH
jgi:ABC-type multidrug transport system fused ATPase/permease subunit